MPLHLFVLKSDDTFVVADAFGDILGEGDGLFRDDTRVLSRFRLTLGGKAPSLLGARIGQDNVLFTANLANHPLPPLGGEPTPEGVIHVERARLLWEDAALRAAAAHQLRGAAGGGAARPELRGRLPRHVRGAGDEAAGARRPAPGRGDRRHGPAPLPGPRRHGARLRRRLLRAAAPARGGRGRLPGPSRSGCAQGDLCRGRRRHDNRRAVPRPLSRRDGPRPLRHAGRPPPRGHDPHHRPAVQRVDGQVARRPGTAHDRAADRPLPLRRDPLVLDPLRPRRDRHRACRCCGSTRRWREGC